MKIRKIMVKCDLFVPRLGNFEKTELFDHWSSVGAMWMYLRSFKLVFVLIQTVLLFSVGLRRTPTNGSCNVKGHRVPYPPNLHI